MYVCVKFLRGMKVCERLAYFRSIPFSYVQITYLFANSNLLFLFFELTSGFFLGVRLNSRISYSRLETVCLDTLTHEVLFLTLLISVQDLKRSFNDILCIIRSSLAEVLRGLLVLKALTILPVSLKDLTTLPTTLLERFTLSEISLMVCFSLCSFTIACLTE